MPLLPPEPYEREAFSGGETTNILAVGSLAFTFPANNLDRDNERRFFSGNAFFNQAWVASPSTTTARDGVGPLFHARSCSVCHFRDGRGEAPEDGELITEGIVKLGLPGGAPDPIYGDQLQPFAIDGFDGEALPRVRWVEEPGTYPDGTPYSLRRPELTLEEPFYGPFADPLQTGIRMAPIMVGLGLLEAIRVEDLEALADPNDSDGDGVSGRIRRLEDGRVGRFGWRAGAPDLIAQTANAFNGDMGLLTNARLDNPCTDAQTECLNAPQGINDGDTSEVGERIFEAIVIYMRTLAVPARRSVDDPEVLMGRTLVEDIGCVNCHAQTLITGDSPIPALVGQRIYPYTDLLLHDLGPDLADGHIEGDVEPGEWRTPPLWGAGLVDDVNGHQHFLHDGRARGFEEAILWHGGEAAQSRDAFMDLSSEERALVIRFLETL
ncbi:MAG: di-heme oxidoredictase family protein [Myxococcota bacterium]